VATREGWLYLAVVLDLASRRVVGWAMQATLTRQLVERALEMALGQRSPAPGLVHHSDRGGQYTSVAYQALLAARGLRQSVSAAGSCYDNAVVESFFHSLKAELLRGRVFPTRAAARTAVFDYLELWYNRHRRHSSLNYQSPAQFEESCTT
jgi:putative transposase